MGVPIVFVDANVLYSKTLRDWLFLLRKETGGYLFTVASSNDVIVEVLNSIRKNNPNGPGYATSKVKEQIEASLDELVRDFPAGMVFPGDDKHDTHVYAASITCKATYLITDDEGFHNVSDQLPYEVHSTDSFFQLIAENVPQSVDNVIQKQTNYYRSRPGSKTLRDALISANCPTFAEVVHRHLQAMSAGNMTAGIAESVEPVAIEEDAAMTPAATMQPLQS